jgi:hypothetical protein
MFFIKYIILSTYRISKIIARWTSSKSVLGFSIKLRMSSVLALYLILVLLFINRNMKLFLNIEKGISLNQHGGFIIVFYFLICGLMFYKLNLDKVKNIQLKSKEKNISRFILLSFLAIVIAAIKK